jgi:hypothetical protein
MPRALKRSIQRDNVRRVTLNMAATRSYMIPNSKALIAIFRTTLRFDTAAPAAVSNSANVQFSAVGVFARREMSAVNHNLDMIARNIVRAICHYFWQSL